MAAELAGREDAEDEAAENEPYEGVPSLTERDLQDMNQRYAQYMSDHGAANEREDEDREYRYHRMALEAELREIERDGQQNIENIDPEIVERDNAMRVSDQHFGLSPFTEVIPSFWREEILEPPDSPLKQPVMYAIMQGFGSLACCLYTRILRICKECKDDNS